MTSSDCAVNPAFCEFNMAYIYYCDGVSFSGDLEAPVVISPTEKIYFRGQRILKGAVKDLLERGMHSAQEVVLSGHSAGGLATYLHADSFGALLPPSVKRYGTGTMLYYALQTVHSALHSYTTPYTLIPYTLAAVPDAGFFLDHPVSRLQV
jgi:hypothetical protein